MRNYQIRRSNRDGENRTGGQEHVTNKTFYLAVFAACRVGVGVFCEDCCQDGKWHGEKVGELLQRQHRAEFLGADVFRHEPEADERLDHVA